MTKPPIKLSFEFCDDIAPQVVFITWGIHKELSEILLKDDNLFNLFTDQVIADKVVAICLAIRDSQGRIIKDFEYSDSLSFDSTQSNLSIIFDYFEDFFFQNQLRIQRVAEKMKTLQPHMNT